jgi:hypothetical protein
MCPGVTLLQYTYQIYKPHAHLHPPRLSRIPCPRAARLSPAPYNVSFHLHAPPAPRLLSDPGFVNHSKCATLAYRATVASLERPCCAIEVTRFAPCDAREVCGHDAGRGLRRGNGERLAKREGNRECLGRVHRYVWAVHRCTCISLTRPETFPDSRRRFRRGCRREEWSDMASTMHTSPRRLSRAILPPFPRLGISSLLRTPWRLRPLSNQLLLGGTSPKWAMPAYIAAVPSLGRPCFASEAIRFALSVPACCSSSPSRTIKCATCPVYYHVLHAW